MRRLLISLAAVAVDGRGVHPDILGSVVTASVTFGCRLA